jgi:hypothetical protein
VAVDGGFVGVSAGDPGEGGGGGSVWDVGISVGVAGEATGVELLVAVGGGRVFSTIAGATGVRKLHAVSQDITKMHPTSLDRFESCI